MPAASVRPRRVILLNFILVFVLGLFVARLPSTLAQIGVAKADTFDIIADVQRMVMAGFVDKPDPDKLTKGAINGMLEALDDPYAEYIPADEAAEFEKAMTGSFSGIGCQLAEKHKDEPLTVASPMEGSPALNAGIIAGDKIVKVNDESTRGKSVDECIKMITGPEGTEVKLHVLRGAQELDFTVTRARIVAKSVRGFRRSSDDTGRWDYLIDPKEKIAYVRLSQFTPTSPGELEDALGEANKAAAGEIKGLILDLRGNPGGLMDAALEISDMFLDSGVIMSTRGREGRLPPVIYKAEPSPDTPKYPIAILANEFSASASEIVAGALSDNNRAIVIGSRTYGKGVVQSVQSLPHDPKASVKFTTQRYYLPSGRTIQRTDDATDWGVDPTPGYYVPMTEDETVAWAFRRRDWDVLRKEGSPLPAGFEPVLPLGEQHWGDSAWVEAVAKDKQLAGALRTMQAKTANGEFVKLSDEPSQHGRIALAELKKLERDEVRMSKAFTLIEKRKETLEKIASTGKGATEPKDLWPDSLDLTGGLVEVRDKDGKVVADLRIKGRDLERWLAIADLEKVPEPGEPGETKPARDSAKAPASP